MERGIILSGEKQISNAINNIFSLKNDYVSGHLRISNSEEFHGEYRSVKR